MKKVVFLILLFASIISVLFIPKVKAMLVCDGTCTAPVAPPPPPPVGETSGTGPYPTSAVSQVDEKCWNTQGVMTADKCVPCGSSAPSGCSIEGQCGSCGGSGPGCTGKCGGIAMGKIDNGATYGVDSCNYPCSWQAKTTCYCPANLCTASSNGYQTPSTQASCENTWGTDQYGNGWQHCTWFPAGTCTTGCSKTCGGGTCTDVCGNAYTCNTQPCLNPPQATTICLASTVIIGNSASFTVKATDSGNNLLSMGFYFSPTSNQSWSLLQSNGFLENTNLNPNVSISGGNATVTATWTPAGADVGKTFYMVPDIYDQLGSRCSSNPWGLPANGSWVTCSNPTTNSYCQITVIAPSKPTLTPGNFNESPTNPYTPVTVTWANGTGLQVWDSAGNWLFNGPATSPTVVNVVPGRTVYARSTYDFMNFSNTAFLLVNLPVNPSSTTIQGNLQQKSGSGCTPADTNHNFPVGNPIVSSTACGSQTATSTTCYALDSGGSHSTTAAVKYFCTTTFTSNNCLGNNPPTWPTSATINLIGVAPVGYTLTGWTDNNCNSPPNPPFSSNKTVSISAGGTINQPITFNFSGNTWFKSNNTSFVSSSVNSVNIPVWATAYPGSSDNNSSLFIIGTAGSTLGVGINLGAAYSIPNNWNSSSYSRHLTMSADGYAAYVRSRKTSTSIGSAGDTSIPAGSITGDGIYLWKGGDLTISDDGKFGAHNVVLISNSAKVTIDKQHFQPAGSVAIVADEIDFSNTTQDAKGIFVANTVNTGSPSNQGLLILGNLIAETTLNNGRSWTNTAIPSIYVDFQPNIYLNLLPYLSIAKYDYKELQ